MTDFIREQLKFAMVRGGLSEQEQNVLFLMIEGLSNKEISRKLFIAIRTVEMYQNYMYRKLNLSGKRELPKWIVENISSPTQFLSAVLHQDSHYTEYSNR